MARLYASSQHPKNRGQCRLAWRWPPSRLCGRPAQRNGEAAAEFLREIDRDTALAIEELRMVAEGHDRAVPDIRMDIEFSLTLAPEYRSNSSKPSKCL